MRVDEREKIWKMKEGNKKVGKNVKRFMKNYKKEMS